MRSILADFAHLWPKSREAVLGPILARVTYLRYPEDTNLLTLEKNPQNVVVLTSGTDIFNLRPFIFAGFRHFINRDRADLSQELLASCLMIAKPATFTQNPLPFFLAGFTDVQIINSPERNLSLSFFSSTDKASLLTALEIFLNKNPKTKSLVDLCTQSADELITNALYNAPVGPNGEKVYNKTDRTVKVTYPTDKKATLFSCFTEERVTIGCEDGFGSMNKTEMVNYLRSTFTEDLAVPRETEGGAGIGMKTIIQNAANFYLYSERGRRTIVAASFLLKGVRANTAMGKHFHWSIT